MTEVFFVTQIDRLKRRFGEKHFDVEFMKLASFEVAKMSEMGFRRAVDVWIGSRSHNKPPLLSEFREAKLNEDKQKLSSDANYANEVFNSGWHSGLNKILREQYGNVTSVNEAVELVRLKTILKENNEDQNHGKDDRKPNSRLLENEGDNGVQD